MTRLTLLRTGLGLLPAFVAAGAMLGATTHEATAAAGTARAKALTGTFTIAPGRYARGRASGSYFRMIFPGGDNKYFKNPDSSARDKTFTLLRPGSAGGLVTGRFQPHPRPPFDRTGNSRAGAIIRPQRFAGILFGLATLSRDPQSGKRVPAPVIRVAGRTITGYLQALTAEWNREYFNQGAPKPGGSRPTVSGTYNPRTGAYVLRWRSLIKGGPFNGFTGFWHLQGTFRRGRAGAAGTATATAAGAKRKRTCKHKHKRGFRKHRHRKCVHRKRARRPAAVTPPPPSPYGGTPLVGTFKLATGTYSSTAGAGGSYFRMIFPGGSVAGGPFFDNPSSAATNKSFTLLSAGADGGLVTDGYQEAPSPPFSNDGHALANRIIQPQRFAGVNFSLATAAKDGQTGMDVPAPSISVADGKLGGQVQALSAMWNKLYFNQGTPKPGGGTPGRTTSLTGTYDQASRAFVLEWASAIVGGPFNGFTGYWHLSGVFEPRAAAEGPLAGLLPGPPTP